ncbi:MULTISPECIES: hypothetical protein [unclassified Streptomyces]|uniref:hypothetical protein n=1 Tax=unclassified Streptomyces TaxID=2593676 RepID=UPI0038165250
MHDDPSEDEILAAGLAALAGSVGGGRGGLTGRVARRMKKNVHETDVPLPLPYERAVGYVTAFIAGHGRPLEATLSAADATSVTLRMVTGGGAGGLNPVVVTAVVTAAGDAAVTVRLRAAAKEGLIKQRAGEKTAVRLAAELAAGA